MQRAGDICFLAFGLLAGGLSWWALDAGGSAMQRFVTLTPTATTRSEPKTEAGGWQPPGEGFVVWESNRTGRWRLFFRDLERGPVRQLTPDEGARAHCCPHVSADGRWIAYLSLDPGPERYPDGPEEGVLRLVAPDGRETVEPGIRARTYGEHRAVTWHSPTELAFLDAEGRTILLDTGSGGQRVLLPKPHPQHGFLPSPDLQWATTGLPVFAPVVDRAEVAQRAPYGGCQPYFSPDSRWGYWTAGAGGPIDKIDLQTRSVATILEKHDPRLPAGQGYLYFPMLSPDGRLLAVAASRDEHAHFGGDYDVFVGEVDPERLEVLGPLARFTDDPSTDRFPAVFLAPAPLGVHDGEAPLAVSFEAPGEGWQWQLGDGSETSGRRVEHTWTEPGRYRVLARRGVEELVGWVRVAPRRPPRVVEIERRDETIVVRFDEPIKLGKLWLELVPGGAIPSAELSADGRELQLRPAAPPAAGTTLVLDGIVDRSQVPVAMPRQQLTLPGLGWPSDRRGLVFLWQDGQADNTARGDDGVERSFALAGRGVARLDRWWRLVLDGGWFEADPAVAMAVADGVEARNAITVELTIAPQVAEGEGAVLFLRGTRGRRRLLTLRQQGTRLALDLITARSGPYLNHVDLGALPPRPSHWAVTYRPGRLIAYRDGVEVLRDEQVQGGLFHWRGRSLTLGPEQDGPTWRGRLEGIAIYARDLSAAEAAENHRRFARRLAEREATPSRRWTGRIVARSRTPSLAEISPYDEALSVFELVGDGPERPGETVRVALYTLLGGRPTSHAARSVGDRLDLELEPFAAQPQLEGLVRIDELPRRADLSLQFDTGPP